ILFTSGSSGEPKGVVLSRRSMFGNAAATVDALPIHADDRLLLNTPFHFTSAICHFLATLISRATLIAVEDKCFPRELVRCAQTYDATAFGGAPIQVRWLGEGLDPKKPLRWWMSSGDHMPGQVIEQLTTRFPKTSLHVVYGLSEVGGRFCTLPPERCTTFAGSVGAPIRGMSLSVRDDTGRELGCGESGEVYASGEYLMTGYLGEDACSPPGPHGFATGDVGHRDAEGNLWLLGRADDVFKVAGQKVSGHSIAAALMETGLFEDAAVVPIDDDMLGTVPGACIVPRTNPIEKSQLLQALRKRLPPNAMPRKFFNVPRIPRTGSGKVKATELRAQLENTPAL
ncbi:MAG: fatty acid--CoA ligase family protein, partial [Gammaproteobacteria bacterium]